VTSGGIASQFGVTIDKPLYASGLNYAFCPTFYSLDGMLSPGD
jgi:hypothetical protein